ERPQQRRLPGAVGADDAGDGPARQDGGDRVDDPGAAQVHGHVLEHEGHAAPPFRRASRSAKTGAPRTAVTMPTGSSRGSKAVRASVSAHSSSTAPPSADTGRTAR